MARTYPELVEEWETKIAEHESSMAQRILRREFGSEDILLILRSWRQAANLADEILGELKAWKEQACGYEASRDLIRERLEFAQREGSEALTRLSWLEENARRLRSYVEGLATCGWCGCYDKCADDCVGPATIERGAEMKQARKALDGFAL